VALACVHATRGQHFEDRVASIGTIGGRILIVWIYNNTGFSVFAAILFHTMANLGVTFYPGGIESYDPAVGNAIIAGAAVLVAAIPGNLRSSR
jgi:hypothetical protein